jgi:type II secretory pathway pseudopilin PulG
MKWSDPMPRRVIVALLIAAVPALAFAPSLLELEAVVAIQGELTATAVPNYVEALDRTKITVAETDMRSIATTLERYRADQGVYPISVPASSPLGPAAGDNAYDRVFTFAQTEDSGPGNLIYPIPYVGSVPQDQYDAGRKIAYGYFMDNRTGHWLIWSPGPDHDYDIDPLRDFWSGANPSPNALRERLFDKSDPNDRDGDLYMTNRP